MNKQAYNLSDLIVKTPQVGRFALSTKLGITVLNYYCPKKTTREQYKIAQRACRLIALGLDTERAIDAAYVAEYMPTKNWVALMAMAATKDGYTLFDYVINSLISRAKES